MGIEIDLLLSLLKASLDDSEGSLAEFPDEAEKVDWEELVRLASWFQVAGFLASRLDSLDRVVEVPGPVRDMVERLAEENRVRFLFFVEPELRRVQARLESENIVAIQLKGTALNRRIYRDLGLRPIGDVDLLIEEHNLEQARRLILELGYSQKQASNEESGNDDDYHYCPRLISPDSSVEFELHRHLVRRRSPLFFDVGELWKRSRPVELGTATATVLDAADQIDHLCLKFFADRGLRQPSYAGLRQLIDVAATLRFHRGEIDGQDLVDRLTRRGHAGVAYCTLETGRRLIGLEIDGNVLDRLRSPALTDEKLQLFIERKLFDHRPWFFHELVEPVENAGLNIARSAARRLLPESRFLREKYWNRAAETGMRQLYRDHLGELVGSILQPNRPWRRMREHLEVDRWMHRVVTGG